MKNNVLYGFVVASMTIAVGCGQKELPVQQTYPVQGKVTVKGEPGAFVTVIFEPKDGKGSPAKAYTDSEGVFTGARTYSNTEMDGMVPGEYDIKLEGYNPVTSVQFMGKRPEGDEKPTPIPPELANTGETRTVEASDNNQIYIDLK
jgi:hypothetical protein